LTKHAPIDAGTSRGSLRSVNAHTSDSKSARVPAMSSGSRPATPSLNVSSSDSGRSSSRPGLKASASSIPAGWRRRGRLLRDAVWIGNRELREHGGERREDAGAGARGVLAPHRDVRFLGPRLRQPGEDGVVAAVRMFEVGPQRVRHHTICRLARAAKAPSFSISSW
jgi:hypothetical protein